MAIRCPEPARAAVLDDGSGDTRQAIRRWLLHTREMFSSMRPSSVQDVTDSFRRTHQLSRLPVPGASRLKATLVFQCGPWRYGWGRRSCGRGTQSLPLKKVKTVTWCCVVNEAS